MLEGIRVVVQRGEHRYTVHAQERMAQRRITDQEVQQALLGPEAEVIEAYPTDKYSPSCLIYNPRPVKPRHLCLGYLGLFPVGFSPCINDVPTFPGVWHL